MLLKALLPWLEREQIPAFFLAAKAPVLERLHQDRQGEVFLPGLAFADTAARYEGGARDSLYIVSLRGP